VAQTRGQPGGSVKQTLTGQPVRGWTSSTSCAPQVGLKQAANSPTVMGRSTVGNTGEGIVAGPGRGVGDGSSIGGTSVDGRGGAGGSGGGSTLRATRRCTNGTLTMMSACAADAAANRLTLRRPRTHTRCMSAYLRGCSPGRWDAAAARGHD